MSIIKSLGTWLLTVIVTYAIAATLATQSVLARLSEMGIPISLGQRFSTTIQDIIGMGSMFLPLVAFSLLIAFVVAAILTRWLRPWRTALFVLAGAVGLLALHIVLEAMLGITPVAAARTIGGLLMQGAAGAIGGWLFVRMNPREPDITATG